MKVWAFDADNTLNIIGSPHPGPIDLRDVVRLKNEGDVIGLVGNYYTAFKNWKDIFKVINFYGPLFNHDKASYLGSVKMDISRARPEVRDFIMVGNRRIDALAGLVLASANDDGQARLAGWRFIREIDFASGKR